MAFYDVASKICKALPPPPPPCAPSHTPPPPPSPPPPSPLPLCGRTQNSPCGSTSEQGRKHLFVGYVGWFHQLLAIKTAQVELRSGRV